MQVVLRFLKTHWMSLTSGAVALLAIVVTVLGLMRDDVRELMGTHAREAAVIDSLLRTPQNPDTIEAEQARGKEFADKYAATVQAAEQINARAPMLPEVFPEPPAGQSALAYRFRELYERQLFELPKLLRAGAPPSDLEVQEEEERMREKAEKIILEGGDPPSYVAQVSTRQGTRDQLDIKIDPDAAKLRAAIRKARSIRIYGELAGDRSSFHVSPIVGIPEPPSPADMWFAQVSYWVQQDVVQAIAALNEDAARALPEDEAYVANMPVKRLIGIQVHGYATDKGLVPFTRSGQTGEVQTESLTPSFSGRVSDPQFDVIRFGLTVIVDQRDVLKLVDRITRTNFYQVISIGTQSLPAEDSAASAYFYGDAPVVRATLQFEGYLARKVYTPMMPADVQVALGLDPAAAQPPRGGR